MREARERLVYEVVRRHERGEGVRAIARTLHIDRKTVRRILKDMETRRSQGDDALAREVSRPRAPRPSKLDKYAADIAKIVHEFPNIRATRLHEELCNLGFAGSYTTVRAYLNAFRPSRKPRAFDIVVTSPGKQAQIDWSPYALEDGTPIHAFSSVLSHSRRIYAHFCLETRQPTIFRELRKSFDDHGGIPGELVFDSMPGIVDGWDFERPILNLRAVDFAAYYGFEIHVAPRANGAYKGKVERRFRFLEESFFNGRKFHSLQEANQTLAWWLANRANSRDHPRLGRPILEVFAQERLCPIPPHPYDDREMAHRVVSTYCYVQFDGNFYKAPTEYVSEWVYIRASEHEVAIIVAPVKVVATHQRAPRNAGQYVPPPETDRPRRRPITEILACFEAWGRGALQYAEAVRRQSRYAGKELAAVLDLRAQWAADDILKAIDHANHHAAYGPRDLERILQVRAKPRTFEDQIAQRTRQYIQKTLADTPVQQRGLAAYARLLTGHLQPPDTQKEGVDEEQDPS